MARDHHSLMLLAMLASTVSMAAVCGAPPGAAGAPGLSREAIASVLDGLPARVEASRQQDRLVGLSLAIVLDGEIVYRGAFGLADVENGRPATAATIYPVASVTKLFTATMLAQMCERGRVGLEDPLQRYLPECRPAPPFPGMPPTTLRQLAAHTAGLPRDAAVNFWCDYAGFLWLVTGGATPMTWYVDRETLLASLGDLVLVHPPEVHAHYSNLGYQLLGIALERAAGEPFAAYLEREVLAPLGMHDSGFTLDAQGRGRLARGYICSGPDAPLLAAPTGSLGCALYSGGLHATAEDLARFLIFQLDADGAAGEAVLSAGTRRRMRTPQSIHDPGVHECYGLGWAVVRIGDHEAIEHNGSLPGYHAHVSAVPGFRLGIVALSNSRHPLWRPDACKRLARSVLADLADALAAAAAPGPFDPGAVELAAYAGRYSLPGGVAHLDVAVEASGLRVTLAESPDFSELFAPAGRHEFCFASDPARTPALTFTCAANGGIGGVTFLSHRFLRQAAGR